MNFTRISIVVVATALVVYFGLSYFFPHKHSEPVLQGGPSPEEVFKSGIAAGPAGASASRNDNLNEAEARKIAEEVGRKVGTQVAQEVLQQSSTAPASTAAAAPEAAEPKSESAPAPAAKPAAAPKPSAPASKLKPRPSPAPAAAAAAPEPAAVTPAPAKPKASSDVASAASAATATKTARTAPAPITPWWTAAKPGGELSLLFAGEAASQRAIALLFSSTMGDAATAGKQIAVSGPGGKPLHGTWMPAPNPRMLLFRVSSAGRYTVKVGAGVADAQGNKLGAALQGPVDVH